jgi:hypothetical protein
MRTPHCGNLQGMSAGRVSRLYCEHNMAHAVAPAGQPATRRKMRGGAQVFFSFLPFLRLTISPS